MTTNTSPHILVLAGSGKTGRRVATQLLNAGALVRAAARSGTHTRFDWDDPSTYSQALSGVQRVYLVAPNTLDFADQVKEFLDSAASAGVEHVTYLSARGVDYAPAEAAPRAVELQLEEQSTFGWSVLRPAWFMQNFSEGAFLPGVVSGELAVPAGDGAEAFISADDIAAVAATTLLEPVAHRGAAYTLTGSEALTFSQVAATIAERTSRRLNYVDADRDGWLRAAIASGLPTDNANLLAGLFDVIKSGAGAETTSSVEEVLGRRPVVFAAFVNAVSSVWTQ